MALLDTSTLQSSTLPVETLELKRAKATLPLVTHQLTQLFQNVQTGTSGEDTMLLTALYRCSAEGFVTEGKRILSVDIPDWKAPEYQEIVPKRTEELYQKAVEINAKFFAIRDAAEKFQFNAKEDPNQDLFESKIATHIKEHNQLVKKFQKIQQELLSAKESLKKEVHSLSEQPFTEQEIKHIKFALKLPEEIIASQYERSAAENQERQKTIDKIETIVKSIENNSSYASSGSEYQIKYLIEGYKSGGASLSSKLLGTTVYTTGMYKYASSYKDTKFSKVASLSFNEPAVPIASSEKASSSTTAPPSSEQAPPFVEGIMDSVTLTLPEKKEVAVDQLAVAIDQLAVENS